MSIAPVEAQTNTFCGIARPTKCHKLRVSFVRSGVATVCASFGEEVVSMGDAIVVPPHTCCGAFIHGTLSSTTLYLDSDYLADQLYWQRPTLWGNKSAAANFLKASFAEPAQLIHLGKVAATDLIPPLDEVVALAADPSNFYRMQSALFAVVDALIVHEINPRAVGSLMTSNPGELPLDTTRVVGPMRGHVTRASAILQASIADHWTLASLAVQVHLSPRQLSRAFVVICGRTPLAYLTMLRAESMARLLRESDLSIAAAGRAVGWSSRSRASEAFRECIGMTPRRYRYIASRPSM